MHGLAVTTVEGIGSVKHGLHPVQERLAASHGSQCGFCTPGIIMSMYTLLRNNPQPSIATMEKAFEGNLCRCTGYRPILEGFKTLTKVTSRLVNGETFLPLDSSQDPIFPPELKNTEQYDRDYLVYRGERVTWYRPRTLAELLDLKSQFPDAKLVIGNTEIGIEMMFKQMEYRVLISPSIVPDLGMVEHMDTGIRLGGSVTLTRLDEELKYAVAGNIITASPISDLNPLFLACGAMLQVYSKKRNLREVCMNEKFFLGYRKTQMRPDEVLVNITLPFTRKNEYFAGYKQAYRREDDIATVNAGMRVVFEDNTNVIKELSLAYGGMAITTVMPTRTMTEVIGRCWDDWLVDDVCRLLAEEMPLAAGSPGGWWNTGDLLLLASSSNSTSLTSRPQRCLLASKAQPCVPQRPLTQLPDLSGSGPRAAAAGSSGPTLGHVSAAKQVTGEAIYIDDIPKYQDELYLAFVTSSKAYANIVSVDPSAALAILGVVDYVGYKDVPGHNRWGAIFPDDEEIFASEQVLCQGQVIGAVIARTKDQAKRAARKVKVEYKELEPIITI
ncbi:XDH-like protein, partial [Mya arenaria]